MIFEELLCIYSDKLADTQFELFNSIENNNIQLNSTQINEINTINDLINKAREKLIAMTTNL